MIQLANKRYQYPNLQFFCYDASDETLPKQLGKFNVILSFSTIHWISNQRQLVQNIQAMSHTSCGLCLMFYSRDNYLWSVIDDTAKSSKWRDYFPNYTTPYIGATEELKQLLTEQTVFLSYEDVGQDYATDGALQFRKYFSGITPAYAPLQKILIEAGETQEKIELMRNDFLDDMFMQLTKIPNDTFVYYEDGSSRFNYTRLVFRGILNSALQHEANATEVLAARTIQRFFHDYRAMKQNRLEQVLAGPNQALLKAFDIRFHCMKAVAAAKFTIKKPIEDKEQEARIIESVQALAQSKNISNLSEIKQLFEDTMLLSKHIQYPYYERIWDQRRDCQKLIYQAYKKLQSLAILAQLEIDNQENDECSPADVLNLARCIIQKMNENILELVSNSMNQEVVLEGFSQSMNCILANYLTPDKLKESEEIISNIGTRIRV